MKNQKQNFFLLKVKKISLEIIAARYFDFSIFAPAQKAGSLAQSVRASDS